MDNKNIEMIANLRKHVVEVWQKLDKESPVAMIKESDSALELQTIIKSLDDLLRPYVKFV
jgi:hypothetical protein